MKKILPYGNCALCGCCGSVQNHHLIPKRLKIETDIKTKIYYMKELDLKKFTINAGIEHLKIQLCKKCHRKLHPENWMFVMNEIQCKKLEELENGKL